MLFKQEGFDLALNETILYSPLEIFPKISMVWRDGRVAEGDGLLNRYTVKSRIGGSNPPLSATFTSK